MANLIPQENQRPGTPDTVWDLSGPGSTNIEGFAVDISVNGNGTQTVEFKINTASSNYRIDIYRMGYYQGNGGRLVATSVAPGGVWGQVSILRMPSVQPAPVTDPSIGLCDAGNWSVSASWAVPAAAVSGVYIAHLVDSAGDANHIPFIVRDDQNPHDIVFQTSDTTWHAYNGWGGYSLYGGGASASSDGRAYKVSYNRPIATRDGVGTYAGPQDFLFGEEIAAIHWLEANGYDVCYIAGVDTDRLDTTGNGGQLLNHKVFLSVGHDEYWSGSSPANSNGSPSLSKGQRANVEAARAAGVNLAFWSGNEVFWKTRYESSKVTTDGSPTAYRTLVCYKETRDDSVLDPDDPPTCTCTWRDPRFCLGGDISPNGDGGRPENALTGTIFMVDDFREDQILIPYPMTKLRFWRNTPTVAATAPGNSGSLVKNYLGYEWDCSPDNGFRPAGLIPLSWTTLSVNTYLLDYGHTEGPGVATHNLTLYRDPAKGALVFGAGTVMWSWGLDGDHDPDPKDPTPTPTDPNVKQAMVNLLFDMGVSAGSLQSGLVPPTQSTDTTAPTSTITFPANNANLTQNQTVTILGTSSDAGGGQVGVVEVSTDGGTTWHPAVGTTSWSYNWTPAAAGPATIRVRGVDDSFNFESPGPSISVTVAAATGISLFSGSDTPAVVTVNDPNPVELGVKFQSSQAGNITAIRFYKGPQNTGTHVGNLWSTVSGTLLPGGTATFSNETSSGWQQVNLPSPVPITANTIYVVSYHTNGEYSADDDYFDTAAKTNGPLTAPATGNVAGGNGVYAYGSTSTFPTNTFLGSNYWVDVVFNPTSSQTWSISGTISPASLGAGATVGLSGAATATATADSSGNYFFSGLANGTYTVTPSRSGDTFSPASQSVTINGANATAVNFTAASSQTWSISGTISPASLGAGTTVGLSGAATANVTADSSGNYSFSGLANGTYTVTPSRSGATFTPTSQSVTINGASVAAVNFNTQGTPGIAIDATIWRDQSTSPITTPAFSTTSGNELLLAFVATDYVSGTNTTVTGVAGGGLTWALVRRTNVQSGTSEIWRAFAPAPLSNVTVTATLSHNVSASLTVMSFQGVDTTGTNGSGAIGATGSGNSRKGAPTASLVTTRNGSWVLGVGNDYDNAIGRTVPTGQALVHQYLAPVGDTYWVQRQNGPTAVSGTTVTINDTAPTSDRYNLTICEVLPSTS
jgi:hypothetical protein